MLRRCSRGGVPVFIRPSSTPSASRDEESFSLARSPVLPPRVMHSPVCNNPRRKVPVVKTTARACSSPGPSTTTPAARSPAETRAETSPSITVSPGQDSTACLILCRYLRRSACAREERTAAPLEEFSVRNWMPVSSIALPISPNSASTSLTSCPLPKPPMAGLHDISPIVSALSVISAVFAPRRAATSAASIPAWPPPTTTISNCFLLINTTKGRCCNL